MGGGKGDFEVLWGAWVVSWFAWDIRSDGRTTQPQSVSQTTVLSFPCSLISALGHTALIISLPSALVPAHPGLEIPPTHTSLPAPTPLSDSGYTLLPTLPSHTQREVREGQGERKRGTEIHPHIHTHTHTHTHTLTEAEIVFGFLVLNKVSKN